MTKKLRETISSMKEKQGANFGAGADIAQIELAEDFLGIEFPEDLIVLFMEIGWFSSPDLDIFGVGSDVPTYLDIKNINNDERTIMFPRLPPYLIAISNDGAGNLYAITRSSSIVVWQHELGEDQVPQPAGTSLEPWLRGYL